MTARKLWADFSSDDAWSSDGETVDTVSLPDSSAFVEGSDHSLAVPCYPKFMNFPFAATDASVISFLGLDTEHLPNLKLLHSNCKKRKFRGIAIFKVTDEEVGKKLLALKGKAVEGRPISIEILKEWVEETRAPQKKQKPFFQQKAQRPVASFQSACGNRSRFFRPNSLKH